MIQIFCNNKIKRFLAVGLSALFLLVVLSPIRSLKASSTVYLGSPYTLDGILYSTDYSGIHNYYDMLVYSFWENYNLVLIERGYPSVSLETCYAFCDEILDEYKTTWISQGYNPSILCNIYARVLDFYSPNPYISHEFIFDFIPNEDFVWSPLSVTIQNDGSLSYSLSDATIFLPWYSNSSIPSVGSGSYTFYPSQASRSPSDNIFYRAEHSTAPVTVKSFTPIDRCFCLIRTDYRLSITSTQEVVPKMWVSPTGDYPDTYVRASNDSYSTTLGFSNVDTNFGFIPDSGCLLVLSSSFPFYVLDKSFLSPRFGIFKSSSSITSSTVFRFQKLNNAEAGQYYFTLSDFVVYEGFSFGLYATPTPYPTVLPSISPTPLPVAYDVNIDGMNDGSTLGFLQGMFNSFQNISSTFTGVSWIASTIGYLFHYTPQFAFILFIPLIATLSFILGRNKS